MCKQLWKCELDRTGSRYGTLVGFGENGNESLGSTDTANTDQWSKYQMISHGLKPQSWLMEAKHFLLQILHKCSLVT
jgi:hypothetical protein